MCHREFQGATTRFQPYHATVLPYVERIVRELGQDTSTISAEFATLVLCTPQFRRAINRRHAGIRTNERASRMSISPPEKFIA